ncbi:MAG: reverse transcriptase family protein, partial [Candidatus Thiodiazotropha endolucinida]
CELQEVKVLRHLEPNTQKEQTVHASQQTAKEGKQHKLLDEVMIGENNLSEAQKNQVKQFLEKWNDSFSEGPTDLGNCDLVKHKINLHDNEPFKEPHRRIPPGLFQEVREHLSEMLQAGAIRPSQSPYSSNVVIVRKKDGSIRFCVDFRKLNSKTIKDAYAIPRVEDSLHLLAGAKYFTKLDLRSGYWQVEIDERDKAKTAFQVGTLGFFEFHRMPFGLCNAPATFQRLMERCMGDMNLRDCLIYLDDVIIFSATFEEHLNRLEAVFSRLKEHNLKLKASKCEFLQSKVTYLGHIVSEAGIQTDPEKTEAIKNWPRPNSVKDVRSFLGFTGYYRRLIKN